MEKKLLLGGVALLIVVLVGVIFVLPAIPRNCQDWYHRVAFLRNQNVVARYGVDVSKLAQKLGHERWLEIHRDTWEEAADEVGAKPFYCN